MRVFYQNTVNKTMKEKDENEDKENKESLKKIETSSHNKQESKKSQLKKPLLVLALISVVVAFSASFIIQKRDSIALRSSEAVSFEVYTKFNEFDQDDDGYLSPKEFELAYFHLTKLESLDGLGIKDVEKQNVSSVKEGFCCCE